MKIAFIIKLERAHFGPDADRISRLNLMALWTEVQ